MLATQPILPSTLKHQILPQQKLRISNNSYTKSDFDGSEQKKPVNYVYFNISPLVIPYTKNSLHLIAGFPRKIPKTSDPIN